LITEGVASVRSVSLGFWIGAYASGVDERAFVLKEGGSFAETLLLVKPRRRTIMIRLGLVLGTAALAALFPLSAQPAPKKLVQGQAYVWASGFDIKYWDTVNGGRWIGRGYDPSISKDGHFVAYAKKVQGSCYNLVVYDARARKNLSLPGLNTGSCADYPRLSGDGRYLVWEDHGTTAGNPSDVFMYDIVAKKRVPLPADVNTGSFEGSPSLTDDGRLLAFFSGRHGGFGEIDLFDLKTNSFVELPSLNTGESKRSPVISGNGSTIAFVTGPELGRAVGIYDRRAGAIEPAPALQSGYDDYDPVLSSSGRLVIYASQRKDLGDRALYHYNRDTRKFTQLSWLNTTLSEEYPGLADPAQILDFTAPRLHARCSAAGACVLTVNEAAAGTVSFSGSGRKGASRSVRWTKAGNLTVRVPGSRGLRSVTLAYRVTDLFGNARRGTMSVRLGGR
jgi:hypothetical protein